MEETKLVTRSAKAFFSGTILSRLSGMARDVLMAFLFGTSSTIATFMLAFRFSNLLRRLLAESPLASSFVPLFEVYKGQNEKKSAEFFKNTFYSLLALTTLVIVVLEIVLKLFSTYMNKESAEIIRLVLIMLPSVAFISFYGLSSALLQCEKSFFIPSVSPVAFNMIWILFALGSYFLVPSSVGTVLSIGVLVAFAFQWLVTLPEVCRFIFKQLTKKECLKIEIFSPEIKAMGKPFLLGMLGVGATQINTALDSVFARLASSEGPAYLWYAMRIAQVPMALFGVALSSAILPPLTRALRDQKLEEYVKLVHFGLKKAAGLMIFATLGIVLCGFEVVVLLFQRGAFDLFSTVKTTKCLYFYSAGLLFQGLVLVLTPAFYAFKDYKTPMKISVVSVVFNVILNAACVYVLHLGAEGIALSTSLASFLQCALLFRVWKKRFSSLSFSALFIRMKTTLVCLVFGALLAFFMGSLMVPSQLKELLTGGVIQVMTFQETSLAFMLYGGVFLVGFLLLAKITKEKTLLGLLKRN